MDTSPLAKATLPILRARCAARGRHDLKTMKIRNPYDMWFRCRDCQTGRHLDISPIKSTITKERYYKIDIPGIEDVILHPNLQKYVTEDLPDKPIGATLSTRYQEGKLDV